MDQDWGSKFSQMFVELLYQAKLDVSEDKMLWLDYRTFGHFSIKSYYSDLICTQTQLQQSTILEIYLESQVSLEGLIFLLGSYLAYT